ncbi:MAG: hypothetical protein ACXWNZ_01310 [Vulcanimicrobiaceae bacterium]
MNVERQPDNLTASGLLGMTSENLAVPVGLGNSLSGPFGLPNLLRGDKVSTIAFPPVVDPEYGLTANGAASQSGGWSGIMTQLMNVMGEITAMIASAFGGFQSQGAGQRFFQNASGSSTGDPHLAFTGTNAGGTSASHFDSMHGHENLLDSDSFNGGFRISTQVTEPSTNGVTWNQSASVTTDGGATQVSLDKNGVATIAQFGEQIGIADGQTIDLGNGESVSRAQDGSLTIVESNGQGGRITATLRDNGNGVDVGAQAQNVDLGGYLVDRTLASQQPAPQSSVRLPDPWRHTF